MSISFQPAHHLQLHYVPAAVLIVCIVDVLLGQWDPQVIWLLSRKARWWVMGVGAVKTEGG